MRESPSYIDQLICTKCEKYLSHFPVFTDKNQNSICGRCEPDENVIYFHNDIYQLSMEAYKFPCSYNKVGCDQKYLPKDIPQHEKWCSYRTVECFFLDPMTESTNCKWEGFSEEILEHFKTDHPNGWGTTFEIDFLSNTVARYLYVKNSECFMFTNRTDSIKNTLSCTLTYMGCHPEMTNGNNKFILRYGKGSKMLVIEKIGETAVIKGSDIVMQTNEPVTIIQLEIDICYPQLRNLDSNDSVCPKVPAINYDVIQGMRCVACQEYMLPPIHLCETGHSICSDCTKTIRRCPTCKQTVKATQNLALAQVISHMIYPCKFDDCGFSCKSKNIRKHEAICKYRPIDCPLVHTQQCSTKTLGSKIIEHLWSTHEHCIVFDGDEIMLTNEDQIEPDHVYLVLHRERIFILFLSIENYGVDGHFTLTIKMYNWNEQKMQNGQYNFDFVLLDNAKNINYYIKGRCGKYSENKFSYKIRSYQIQDCLIDGDKLCFRTRIVET